MDKELKKLVTAPWLESIRMLQFQAEFSTLASQKSETERSIQMFDETTKLASLALGQSTLLSSAQAIAESTKFEFPVFPDSEALESIRELTAPGRFSTLALEESKIGKSLQSLAETFQLSSTASQHSAIEEQLQNITDTDQLATAFLGQSQILQNLSQINDLASFKALTNLHNSPFPDIYLINISLDSASKQVFDESFFKIDSQISEEISSEKDFKDLSEKTKIILIYVYHNYFLPFFISCLAAYTMNHASEARKELESISTNSEVKIFVRSSHDSFDRSALKGFRVTTASYLNVRKTPSMRSEVITILPCGTLVEIIDKSQRSWLLVEIAIDGELDQGWVSRRYTTYFK